MDFTPDDFAKYYGMLLRYALKWGIRREDAEDITMDTLTKAWQKYDPSRSTVSSLSSYLYSIQGYGIKNFFRQAKYAGLSLEQQSDPSEDADDPPKRELVDTSGSSDPVKIVVETDLLPALQKALLALNASNRHIIVARLDGKSHIEIARELGIACDTVRVRHYRALRILRQALAAQGYQHG